MITHVVRMSVRPDVTPEQLSSALQLMATAGSSIGPESGVTGGSFGRDIGGGFDFGAVSRLDDLDAYEAMMNHPTHLEVDRIGLSLVDRFHSFDITDDQDPEVHEKIADIHRRRFEAHPDILDLVRRIDDYQGSGVPGRE
jgi:hypothetical protein